MSYWFNVYKYLQEKKQMLKDNNGSNSDTKLLVARSFYFVYENDFSIKAGH
jgi:hypothetical protein